MAQSRFKPHQWLEKINPIANIPYIFSDRLREIKDEMIQCDDSSREQAKDLKSHLSKAETAFNRRQYVECFFNIRKFYVEYKTVDYTLGQFKKKVDELRSEIRGDVLYGDRSKEEIENIVNCSRCKGTGKKTSGDPCSNCNGTGRQIREESKENTHQKKKEASLEKEAGISDFMDKFDFIHNLTNEKARSVYFWEVAFPKESAKIKNSLSSLIKESKEFLEFLLSSFDELSWTRANREIENYLNIIVKLRKRFWDKYNEKYFHYVKLAFQDDAKLFYSHLGLSESEVDKIKNSALEEASAGPNDPPVKKQIEEVGEVAKGNGAEDVSPKEESAEKNNASPTALAPLPDNVVPINSKRKENTGKFNEVGGDAVDPTTDTDSKQVEDDVRIQFAKSTIDRAQKQIEEISKSIEDDRKKLINYEKSAEEINSSQERMPDELKSEVDRFWPGEFNVDLGMEGLKELLRSKKNDGKNNKDKAIESSVREIEKKINRFEKVNPQKLQIVYEQIYSINRAINAKQSEISKIQKKIDKANEVITSLSGVSKAAQRRWFLKRIASKLNN